jgi:hypothetical protein
VNHLPLCLVLILGGAATVLLYAYAIRVILAAERRDDWED